MRGKRAVRGKYNSIEFDSHEELYCLQWLFELKEAGIITSIKRAESYLLSDRLSNDYAEQLKTTSKPRIETVLRGHSYTPEFEVTWDKQKSTKFIHNLNERKKITSPLLHSGDFKTIIEVKPSFDQNNMERLFILNQKWMCAKFGIFVNLVKVNNLFPATFTPKAFLKTPSGKPRMIKWRVRSLFNFLNNKK